MKVVLKEVFQIQEDRLASAIEWAVQACLSNTKLATHWGNGALMKRENRIMLLEQFDLVGQRASERGDVLALSLAAPIRLSQAPTKLSKPKA